MQKSIWKQMFRTRDHYLLVFGQPLLIIIGTIGLALFQFPENLSKPKLWAISFGIAGLMLVVNIVACYLGLRVRRSLEK